MKTHWNFWWWWSFLIVEFHWVDYELTSSNSNWFYPNHCSDIIIYNCKSQYAWWTSALICTCLKTRCLSPSQICQTRSIWWHSGLLIWWWGAHCESECKLGNNSQSIFVQDNCWLPEFVDLWLLNNEFSNKSCCIVWEQQQWSQDSPHQSNTDQGIQLDGDESMFVDWHAVGCWPIVGGEKVISCHILCIRSEDYLCGELDC